MIWQLRLKKRFMQWGNERMRTPYRYAVHRARYVNKVTAAAEMSLLLLYI